MKRLAVLGQQWHLRITALGLSCQVFFLEWKLHSPSVLSLIFTSEGVPIHSTRKRLIIYQVGTVLSTKVVPLIIMPEQQELTGTITGDSDLLTPTLPLAANMQQTSLDQGLSLGPFLLEV